MPTTRHHWRTRYMADNARGRVKVETGAKRVRLYLGQPAGGGHPAAAAGLGEALLPDVLRPGEGRPGRAEADRRVRALAEPRRRAGAGRPHRRRDRRGQGPHGPGVAAGGAARRGPVRLRRLRLVRGGRADLHPPARPVQPHRRPGQQPALPRRARRRGPGRVPEQHDPVRDRPAAALLRADHRAEPGHPAALGHRHALPLQGRGDVLVGRRSATRSTTTSSGATARRSPRCRRSPGWPPSTTRRSTSTSTASCRSGRRCGTDPAGPAGTRAGGYPTASRPPRPRTRRSPAPATAAPAPPQRSAPCASAFPSLWNGSNVSVASFFFTSTDQIPATYPPTRNDGRICRFLPL